MMKNKGQKIKKTALLLVLFIAGFVLLCYNSSFGAGIQKGLHICGSVIIPSMFAFMIVCVFATLTGITDILSRFFSPITRHLFQAPQAVGGVYLLSLVGGYPSGAKMLENLVAQNKISADEAENALCYCCNGGIAFLITVVGIGFLHSWKLGILIFCSQFLASLFIGFFLRISSRRITLKQQESNANSLPASKNMPMGQALVVAVNQSAASMITICAFIIFFSGIMQFVYEILFSSTVNVPYLYTAGFLEVTRGCMAAQGQALAPVVMSAMSGFAGISIILQIQALVSKQKIKTQKFIIARLVNAFLCTAITYALLLLFPDALPASQSVLRPLPVLWQVSPIFSIILLMMCAMLFAVTKKACSPCRKRKSRQQI